MDDGKPVQLDLELKGNETCPDAIMLKRFPVEPRPMGREVTAQPAMPDAKIAKAG